MIQSMTGYGKSTAVVKGKKIHVEIKSLNSKALDLSARIVPLYREKEMEIRAMISQDVGARKSGLHYLGGKRRHANGYTYQRRYLGQLLPTD